MSFLLDYYYGTDGFSYSSSTSGFGGIISIISIITSIVLIVSLVLIFKKAGYGWWKVFIPIYNIFCFHQLIGLPGKFTLAYFLLPVAAGALVVIIPILGVIIYILVAITLFIMHCVECDRMAKSFGKDILWSVLIFLFEPVMFIIIGFSPNIEYVGGGVKVMPRLVPANNGTTPMNFDPSTGQPINNEQPSMNFDPNTGQPISQVNVVPMVEPQTEAPTEAPQINSDLPDSIDSIIIKQ